MMTKNSSLKIVCLLIVILGIASFLCAKPIIIYAASSLTIVMDQLEQQLKANDHITIKISHGSSGILAKQVAHGAPAHMFISANKEWVDYLVDSQVVEASAIYPILENTLSVVSQQGTPSILAMSDLKNIKSLAIGDPKHVPAGRYAVQALEKHGLWSALKDKVIMGKDVRHALQLIKQGVVDGAVVYSSDIKDTDLELASWRIDKSSHDPIIYYLAVLPKGRGDEQTMIIVKKILNGELNTLWQGNGFYFYGGSR